MYRTHGAVYKNEHQELQHMAHSLDETQMQGIEVVEFIKINIQYKMMNTHVIREGISH